MARPKGFAREDVLTKAIGLFWEKGFSETSLQDLEQVTGVNKSGLYSEFKNKEDIFLESLRYYLQNRGGHDLLTAEPLGFANIERFLKMTQTCYIGHRGCFSINSLRDVAVLPSEAREIIDNDNAFLKKLIIANIKAERPGISNAPLLADMLLTFFAGLCIEQNVVSSQVAVSRKISSFMDFLRELR